MAETVQGFKFPSRYPWDQWANGEQWKLKQGEDFHVGTKSFRGAAWQHARSNNLGLSTSVVREDGATYMVVQFSKSESDRISPGWSSTPEG